MSQIERKWVADNAINNDKIDPSDTYDMHEVLVDSTNAVGGVGIGTTDPQDALDIRRTSTAAGLRVNLDDGATGRAYRIYSESTGLLNIRDINATTGITLDGLNGNVGVNTESPTDTLHIQKTSTIASLQLDLNDGVSGRAYQIGSNDSGNFIIRDLDAGITRLTVDSTGAFHFTNDATVGGNFEVEGTVVVINTEIIVTDQLEINQTDDQAALIASQDSGAATAAVVRIENAGNGPALVTDWGKVGIGTGDPSSALTVYGDSSSIEVSSNDYTISKITNIGSGADLDRGLIEVYDTGNVSHRIGATGPNYFNSQNTDQDFVVHGVTNNLLYCDGGSNFVGLGTSVPTTHLEIAKGGTSTRATQMIISYNDQPIYESQLLLVKSNSDTIGTLSETQDGDDLGEIVISGVNSSSSIGNGAAIQIVQNGSAGASYVPADLKILTSTNSAIVERIRVKTTGYVGINTSDPEGLVDSYATAATVPNMAVTYNEASTTGGSFHFRKERSGGIITTGDTLGVISARGHDGNDMDTEGARIQFVSEGTIASNRVPGRIELLTHPDSVSAAATGLSVNSDQNVEIDNDIVGTNPSRLDIRMNTSDGADNKAVYIGGGGDSTNVGTGGIIALHGNEHAGFPGDTFIYGGATGDIAAFSGVSATERIRITNAGPIGINTSTPDATCQLQLYSPLNGTPGLTSLLINPCVIDANCSAIKVVQDSVGANPQFIVTQFGQVGIGTADPNASLHVEGDIVGFANATFSASRLGSSTRRWSHLYMASTIDYSDNLNFDCTSTRVTLTTNGFVGIGSTTPTTSLDVNGTSTFRSGSIFTSNIYQTGSFIGIGTAGVPITGTQMQIKMPIGAPNLTGLLINPGTGSDCYSIKVGTSHFVINESGRVGIGTTGPTEQLEVNGGGIHAINGNIRTTSGNVYVDGNVGIGTTSLSESMVLYTDSTNTKQVLRASDDSGGRKTEIAFRHALADLGTIYFETVGAGSLYGNLNIGSTSSVGSSSYGNVILKHRGTEKFRVYTDKVQAVDDIEALSDVVVTGDVYTTALSNYFSSSSFTGISSPSGSIYYKKIGTTAHVWFNISGTDTDANNFYFTLPYTCRNTANYYIDGACRVSDAGSYQSAPGRFSLSFNSNILYIHLDFGTAPTWAGVGTKSATGFITYETA